MQFKPPNMRSCQTKLRQEASTNQLAEAGNRLERAIAKVQVTTSKRIEVIYAHLIHEKSVRQIIKDCHVNYSTVRHILLQYYLYGRVDVRKFRLRGYAFK